jgi:hypothetical protein
MLFILKTKIILRKIKEKKIVPILRLIYFNEMILNLQTINRSAILFYLILP